VGKIKESLIILGLVFLSYWAAFIIQHVAGATYSQIMEHAEMSVSPPVGKFTNIPLGDSQFASIHFSIKEESPRERWAVVYLREKGVKEDSQLLLVKLREAENELSSEYSITSEISILPRVRGEEEDVQVSLSALEEDVDVSSIGYVTNEEKTLVKVNGGLWGVDVTMSVDQNTFKALVLSEARRASNILGVEIDRQDLDQIGEVVSKLLLEQYPVFTLRKSDYVSVLIFSGVVERIILIVFSFAILLTGYVVVRHIQHSMADSPDENDIQRTYSFGIRSAQFGQMLTLLGLLGTLIGVFVTVVSLGNADFVDELRKVFDQSASFGAMGDVVKQIHTTQLSSFS